MSRRLLVLVTGLAGLLVAAVTACSSSSPHVGPAPRVTTSVNPALAPVPPASGAYFGAWVGPDVYTQLNEINAVNALQRRLGRKLSIVHTYVKWQAKFPTTSALTFLGQGSMLLISWAGLDPDSGRAGQGPGQAGLPGVALGDGPAQPARSGALRPGLRPGLDPDPAHLRRGRGAQRGVGVVPDLGGVRRRPGGRVLPG